MNILCYGPLSLSLHAQGQNEAKVTLSLRNATVEEFAMEVARQTGLTISYDNDNVKTLRRVTFDVREQSLSSLLLTLSNQLPLAYSMEGDTLKLARKEPAQRKTGIYGQVTDEHGEPLIGAIIRVEGVNGGYVTDINGDYQIQTDKKEARITVSSIGYRSVTKLVRNGSSANIVLYEDTREIQEVVVTGYVTKNKNSFTGAQVAVNREQLLNMGTKNVLQSLSSFVPGMVILEDNLSGFRPQ